MRDGGETMSRLRTVETEVDYCIVGGGLAGLCAAIAAARRGVRVALMQDRPMLGGNASSEMRMWIGGAKGIETENGAPAQEVRETGILEELMLENFYINPRLSYSIWDSALFEKAKAEPNLSLFMNCSCLDAETDGNVILSVTGWQLTTQTFHRIKAKIFADCSGDSILAPLVGAEFRWGREARSEYNEPIAPIEADSKTMGMSILFQYRETDSPKPFYKPEWAYTYTDEDIPYRPQQIGTNFWWIEIGGEQNGIYDTEELRDELIKISYGIWDHMKNGGDHGMENYDLEWIGILPGKRESRRYVGEYVVTQHDVEAAGKHFPDIVAYGGWSMDDHFPAGMKHMDSHPTIYHPAPSPWGIPYRALISRNIKNLMFAGRNISTTHTAMSSSRVMASCALMGQAIGTAAAQAIRAGQDIREIDVSLLQETLMEDDVWIPFHEPRRVSPLTLAAETNAPVLRNGEARNPENKWIGKCGDAVYYAFDGEREIKGVRIVFDSDLGRKYYNMPCAYLKPMTPENEKYHIPRLTNINLNTGFPKTMITDYRIDAVHADGSVETVLTVEHNRLRLARHSFSVKAKEIRLIPLKTAGSPDASIYEFEVL